MKKRIFAWLLVLGMIAALFPAAAFAEDLDIVIDDEELTEDLVVGEPTLDESADEITIIEPNDEPDTHAPGPDAEIQTALEVVDTGSCGESQTWTLYQNGLLQITGYGAMTDYAREGAPWYGYRGQITSLAIDDTVEHIGSFAFFGCIGMTWSERQGYTLPGHLHSIGDCAFLSCYALDYVDLQYMVSSVGRQAFGYCTGLKRVTVRSAPSLGDWAFGDCTALEEIGFLGGVPTFSNYTFDGSAAATAWYPDDLSVWTEDVLQNYGGTLTWMPGYHGWCGDEVSWDFTSETGALYLYGTGATWDYANQMYESGGAVTATTRTNASFCNFYRRPDGKTLLGLIRSVSVGRGVTSVGSDLFSRLGKAESISLPDTMERIAQSAFLNCESLVSVVFPASVTSIGYNIFSGCSALKEIHFLGHPPAIQNNAFQGVYARAFYEPVYSWTSDKRQNYGGSLTWIPDDRVGNYAVWTLDASGALTISGSGATWDFFEDYPGFYNFRNECKSISISSGITGIGAYLFYGINTGETIRVEIPASVKELGSCAFSWCGPLRVRFAGSAPSFVEDCFYGVTATALYPANDASWTDSVRQNYGGTITWVSIPGWQSVDGVWVYYDAAGSPVTGWQKINGYWYYFNDAGAMQTGWQKIGNIWYYFASGGAMQTGWQQINGHWYYFSTGGAMQIGWQKINGYWYYLSAGGVMQTGWQKINGYWYYLSAGGAMQTGWQQINGTWYYLSAGGVMQTGWQQINGYWYYLSAGGAMQTGWQKIGGNWYYFSSGGAMQTGWLKLNNNWYYLDASGAMLANTSRNINGKVYYFNASGVCTNP
ncbi:MAG: leucine-rich repeat protein [Clostridia bacterium]